MNFTIDFQTIKDLIMEHGFFTVTLTFTLCALLLIIVWRLPEIIRAWKGK